jgi:hypothetical protein
VPALPSTPSKEAPVIVPDTLEGAIVLSLIDFFLSIVMIVFIGVVLSLLPMLNRLGKLDDESLRRH